jgi:hypothetical protein
MRRGLTTLALALAGVSACSGSSTEFWQPKNALLPMVALDDRIAYVDKTSATAFLLDPGSPSLEPSLVPVGKNPLIAVKHTGSNRLFVVSAGDRGSTSTEPVKPQLALVDPASFDPPGTLTLDSRFDGLAQSTDGQFVVLYHTSSTQDANDGALFNPNDLVVLDFENPNGMPKATPKSIRSMGGVPTSPNGSPIQFSPLYNFQAGSRRLAVVLSNNYVTIFDLKNLGRSEISVPLCPTSGACNYSVNQVVFDPDNLNIYIRVEGAKDIYQVTLTDLGLGNLASEGNDFNASLSMLAVGASATDMRLYGTGKDARLAVVAPANRSLVIIDPNTSRSVTAGLEIPANGIIPFAAPSLDAKDPAPRNVALLVDTQRGSSSVVFADLESVESSGDQARQAFTIRGSVSGVLALPEQGMAILLYGRSSGGAALSVVDLVGRSFFDFNSASGLGDTWNIELRGTAPSRLWSVDSPDDGAKASSGIHFMDLSVSGSQTNPTVWLDQTISSITALAKPSSDGRRHLVLENPDPNTYGNLTLLDADNPDRATARSARGFLFTNTLGRTAP